MVQPFFHVRLKAEIHAQAQDGADLHDYLDIPAVSVNDIPDDEEVFSRLHLMAQTMRARLQAKSAADDMAPVLFQGQAAAEFFGQLLADNLGAPRVAVIGTDENRFNPFMNKNENPLKSYIDRILLPESINVIDDPTLKEYKGKDLLSHYKYDFEGVAGQKMVVVEKGKFKKFLSSRTPTKYSEKSDGHAMPRPMGFPKGTISNLLIKGDKGKSSRKLIKALRKLCKKQGLSHGYLVTRIAPRAVSNNLNPDPDMFFNMMAGKNQDEGMLTPLVVYKIDAKSGKKELVRNASFAGVGVDLFSKISAYSKEVDLYSFGVSNPAGGFGFGPPLEVAICSIVCPDVLIEKMSIRERTAKNSFRPYLENPLKTAGSGQDN
jgi:predicted Zn-dependent protease